MSWSSDASPDFVDAGADVGAPVLRLMRDGNPSLDSASRSGDDGICRRGARDDDLFFLEVPDHDEAAHWIE